MLSIKQLYLKLRQNKMNNWPKCNECGKYFPISTQEEHITGKCTRCITGNKGRYLGFNENVPKVSNQ